ncbi:MAG: iron-containing alcohol dehydrogenase [Thermodesulfobacteriota bacterium]|nr:iron-containing alcohol dehydrogenase [Thermodesulfobacteriota bacterium]
MDTTFFYAMPTDIYFGNIENLRPLIENHRVFFVTGKTTLTRPPLNNEFGNIVKGVQYKIFSDIGPNPRFSDVRALAKEIKGFSPDIIIAIGGGSPIDAAKAASIVATNKGDPYDYFAKGLTLSSEPIPIIAIPTTTGTGSEVTPFSVIVDEENHAKLVYSSPKIYPKAAIVDPRLSYTMPGYVAASTGVDALSHAIEAVWTKRANPVSTIPAKEAIKIILRNIVSSYRDNTLARESMIFASMLAGCAFSNTGVTAVHSASYPITLDYDTPHGHACGLFLLPFIKFNWPFLGEKAFVLLDAFGAKSCKGIIKQMEGIMGDLGLVTRFSEIGLKKEDIPHIAKRCIGKSTTNNPRDITESDIADIIKERL